MNAPLLQAHGWCRERDRRWLTYHDHAKEKIWPQSLVFLRPELGLLVCIRGAGGGSQQATFRGTLEAYLNAASLTWSADQSGTLDERLLRLSEAVQREFQGAVEPFFANQFQGLWVSALTDETDCVLRTHGRQRAYLLRSGLLRQVSEDSTLWTKAQQSNAEGAKPWMNAIEFSTFGAGQFGRDTRGASTRFKWQPNDLLLLVSACPDEVDEQQLQSLLAESLRCGDLERSARQLYDSIETCAPNHPDSSSSWPRLGAVLLARWGDVVVADG